MSVTLDVNILVHANRPEDPLNPAAAQLVQRLAAGPEIVYVFWPTAMGFLRIITSPRIFPQPMSGADALSFLTDLLGRPHVLSGSERDGFLELYADTAGPGANGNIVPDAHVATLMRQHDVATIYTRDRDFRRFDGITAVDPFS